MEKHKNFGQQTMKWIMTIVVLFLIADVVIFVLMLFKVDLNSVVNNFTENNVFNNLEVKTDNVKLVTITPKATDNSTK